MADIDIVNTRYRPLPSTTTLLAHMEIDTTTSTRRSVYRLSRNRCAHRGECVPCYYHFAHWSAGESENRNKCHWKWIRWLLVYRCKEMKAPKNRGIFLRLSFFRRQLFGWRLVAAEKLHGATKRRSTRSHREIYAWLWKFISICKWVCEYATYMLAATTTLECFLAFKFFFPPVYFFSLPPATQCVAFWKACAFTFFFLFAPFIILIILKLFAYAYSPFDPLYLTPWLLHACEYVWGNMRCRCRPPSFGCIKCHSMSHIYRARTRGFSHTHRHTNQYLHTFPACRSHVVCTSYSNWHHVCRSFFFFDFVFCHVNELELNTRSEAKKMCRPASNVMNRRIRHRSHDLLFFFWGVLDRCSAACMISISNSFSMPLHCIL